MPIVSAPLELYAEAHTTPEAEWMARAAAATRARTKNVGMLTGHLEGRFLEFLVWMLQPRLVVEVGTFTGYGALSMAAALGDEGRIITCELDPAHAALAREHIAASPHAGRIDVRVGPALDTLVGITAPIDFAFIDADKANYVNYYDVLVDKLSPRGVIAADNVLWGGRVLDETVTDADTLGIRAFNEHVLADDRVTSVMTTVRDGVTLIRRR